MKPIIIKNSRVPALVSWFFPVAAITLWPFIFVRKDHDSPRLLNHEAIHIHQYNEMLVLGFLLVYIYDWAIGLIKYRDAKMAYLSIRFEQEARHNDANEVYLERRKPYSWREFTV